MGQQGDRLRISRFDFDFAFTSFRTAFVSHHFTLVPVFCIEGGKGVGGGWTRIEGGIIDAKDAMSAQPSLALPGQGLLCEGHLKASGEAAVTSPLRGVRPVRLR